MKRGVCAAASPLAGAAASGGEPIAAISLCASSTEIFPCARRSRMRRTSSFIALIGSSFFSELAQHVVDARFTALETGKQLARGRARRLALRRGRLDFHERKQRADAIQPVLDRGIADAEKLLHLLDRAVAADERRHEDLVLGGELRERWQTEASFDRDSRVAEPDALDFERGAAGQLGERLPILSCHNYVDVMSLRT